MDSKPINQNTMTLNEYQEKAMTTCLPTCDNFSYMMLNLVGEVGELAGKVGKALRKETGAIVDYGEFYFYTHQRSGEPKSRELYEDLKSEAGDILWQLAGLCKTFGWTLEDVAQCNLDKLAARKAEGTIISHTDH